MRSGIVEAAQFQLQLFTGLQVGGHLRGGGFDAALQFVAACRQRARLEARFLGLALQRALLFTRVGQLAFRGDDGVVQLGVFLLRVAQADVEFFEARFAGGLALFQRFQLGVDLGQLFVQLVAAAGGGVQLLRQAQQFHVQAVGAGLRLAGFTARRLQALAGVGVGRFQAHAGALGVFGDQHLRTLLAVEAFDFLRTGQHAGLFTVGRVKGHGVLADGMALAGHDHFALRQLAALRQRFVDAGGGVDTFQPIGQQRLQTGITQPQQLRQLRQRLVAVRRVRRGAARKRPAWPVAHRRRKRARCPGGPPTARSVARAAPLPARFPSRLRCAPVSTGPAGR